MHEGSSQSARTAQCDRFPDVVGDSNLAEGRRTYNLHQLKLQVLRVETVQFILSVWRAGNERRHSEQSIREDTIGYKVIKRPYKVCVMGTLELVGRSASRPSFSVRVLGLSPTSRVYPKMPRDFRTYRAE